MTMDPQDVAPIRTEETLDDPLRGDATEETADTADVDGDIDSNAPPPPDADDPADGDVPVADAPAPDAPEAPPDMEVTPDDGADLPGYHPTEADRLLDEVLGDAFPRWRGHDLLGLCPVGGLPPSACSRADRPLLQTAAGHRVG